MVPWNSAKAKVQLRLGVQRLRTLQEKKGAQAKASRRDIALMIEKGKIETARIKVENIIHEDIYVELLELLELYCELLIARFGLLDQNAQEPDAGISEGVCSIIFAAPHTELKELHVLRDLLMHKYGREFSIAVMENRDRCVSERVTRKLNISTPPASLVDAYLTEIAKGYGLDWSPLGSQQLDDANDGGPNGGVKVSETAKSSQQNWLSDDQELASEKRPEGLESPVPMRADAISAEARSAGIRTPKLPELPPVEDEPTKEKGPVSKAPSNLTPKATEDDEFAALAKRFEALKKH
ncbi:protein IST1 [Grifola frondosa]|uniref:Protein IST1 n=1 Tax=Grifola frondosa TaxID=5627 RepID=A0A1C7MR82_GRIFR|nr:protein IST1 [Grifola frondosa]